MVRQAVAALDDRYRLPVLLYYFEGLTTREAAEALGISQTAVTTRLSRAVGKLRDHLRQEGALLTIPAIITLLKPGPAEAAPATLAARLEGLAAGMTAAAPAPAGLAGVLGGALATKAAAAALVVVLSLGGIGALRRLPPPSGAGAAVPRASRGTASEAAAPTNRPAPSDGSDRSDRSDGAPARGAARHTAAASRPGQEAAPAAGALQGGHSTTARGRARRSGPPARAGGVAPAGALPAGSPLPAPTPRTIWPAQARTREMAAAGPAAGPPAAEPASPTGPRKMSADERRRFALDLLLGAWEELQGRTAQSPRQQDLLPALVRINLGRADALAATLPEQAQPAAREGIVRALLVLNPEDALVRLKRMDPTSYLLRAAAQKVAPRNRQAARDLLDRAVEAARKAPVDRWSINEAARLALLAREIEHPRAVAMAKEVPGIVPEAIRLWEEHLRTQPQQPQPGLHVQTREERIGEIAALLAPLDRDAATKVCGAITDGRERFYAGLRMAAAVARLDPAWARTLLEERRPGATTADLELSNWARFACTVAWRSASRDPAGDETLARSIPDPLQRTWALIGAGRGAPPTRARALYQDAFAAMAEVEDDRMGGFDLRRTPTLLPAGPERRLACALTLGFWVRPKPNHVPYAQAVPIGMLAEVAFVLASVDPEGARVLVEDALAGRERGREDGWAGANSGWDQSYVALALAAAGNPVRAVEVARALPRLEYRRYETLRRIATITAMSDEERARGAYLYPDSLEVDEP